MLSAEVAAAGVATAAGGEAGSCSGVGAAVDAPAASAPNAFLSGEKPLSGDGDGPPVV